MANLSVSEENYVKSVYHLQQQQSIVNTNALANHISTSAASVTDMLKKLRDKKIIHYKPYKGFYLSKEGTVIALNIIRRHRLWEFFLSNVLHFSWEEVHEIAEQLEHVSNNKLIDKLDAFLNYPAFDPHGDPIPDSKGKISIRSEKKLSELPVNQSAIVTSVASYSAELLSYLNKCNIQIGTRLQVKQKFAFDNSVEVKIKNNTLSLSEQLTNALNVKTL